MLNAFSDFDRHFAEFERLLGIPGVRTTARPRHSGPRFNVEETDQAWTIRGLLPGWSAESLEITLDDGNLVLKGEQRAEIPEGYRPVRRERGDLRFTRSLRLPEDVDLDKISAGFKDGVLTLTLPRKPKAAPRRIEVQRV